MQYATTYEALALTFTERSRLEEWTSSDPTPHALVLRSRIILRAATGRNDREVAAELRISRQTVCKWKRRFLTERLAGLLDRPRAGAPRRIPDAAVQRVVDLITTGAPPGQAHWSTRSLSRATGLSQSTISRIWRAQAREETSRGFERRLPAIRQG